MKSSIVFFICLVIALTAKAQGSGKSAEFNGSNYFNLDSIFLNLTLPVTITHWVKKSGIGSARFFSSNQVAAGYSGVHTQMLPSGVIEAFYGDGLGFTPSFRRSVYSNNPVVFSDWVHLAFIISGPTNMQVFVNGIEVASNYVGSGGSMFQNTSGTGSIARLWTNNGWSYYSGEMDDFTIWNKALSTFEIRDLVCKKTNGSANQLLGYFDFDMQVGSQIFDNSANNFVATNINSVNLQISGAAIGDTSYYTYSTSSVGNFSQTLTSGDQIEVSNISANTKGVQLYEVLSGPNTVSGIPPAITVNNYFGVFLAVTDNATKTYQLQINNWAVTKQLYKRDANNDLTWVLVNPISVIGPIAIFPTDQFRQEYVIVQIENCSLDLGPDISDCPPLNIWLKDLYFDTSKTYTWNGTLADSINVTSPQQIIVQMDSAGCILTDTVYISEKSVSINLGADTTLCNGHKFWLKDLRFHPTKTYSWSTGVVADSVLINSAQTVFVTVDSADCTATDNIVINTSTYPPPIFIDEIEKCVEEPLNYTFPAGSYTFLWPDGSTLNTTIIYTQTQLSFFTISPCGDTTLHTIDVIQNICNVPCDVFVPNAFTPNDDGKNDYFVIGINCITTAFSVQIFNRWGGQVYYSEDPYFKWDGQFEGRNLADGVYVYIINLSGFYKNIQTKHGMITLMR